MERKKDYDRAAKSFMFNGLPFYRLYATTGGTKKGVVIFASERVYNELYIRLNNNRNVNKPLVPAKFESYKSLASSASAPVRLLNNNSVACISDYKHNIYKDVTLIHNNRELTIEEKENYELEVNANDGYGFISYRLAEHWSKELDLDYVPGGFCVRFAFTKGMLYVFDYHKFAKDEAKSSTYVDVWGNEYSNIDGIDIVLTASMLKLWSSYKNIEQFMESSIDNDYSFAVTKVTPKKLENERELTYQFIQSLHLSDDDIDNLIKHTVQYIKDVKEDDWRKSLLFLKGIHLTNKSLDTLSYDFAHALMLEPKMINDPFVRSNIRKMIAKTINDAKIGRIKVNGNANYQILGGDPFALAQHMFNMKVTGLLNDGEFYSNYWNKKKVNKVASFRAPMSCHENICILNFKNNQKMQYWYQHMDTVTILNIWDTTTHSLNGCDYDGDQLMSTDNQIIINSIIESNAIVCEQGTALPKIIEEADLLLANKQSKGDKIGSITNKATAMYDILSFYPVGSPQHTEVSNRIKRSQKLQQDSIDKAKGIEGFEMPSEWYDYKSNVLRDKESNTIISKNEFNISILADKNPYFMIYRYEHIKKEYNDFMKKAKKNCSNEFGIELDKLLLKEDRTSEEEEFVKYFNLMNPVMHGKSVMNKLCKKIEKNFGRKRSDIKSFDYSILKSPKITYSKKTYNDILELYEEYKSAVTSHEQRELIEFENEEDEVTDSKKREIFKERFEYEALKICSSKDILCNIVVDMVYSTDNSKQFAWDIAGETIISNLKIRSNSIINYVELDPEGDVFFAGERFTVKTIKMEEEE